MYASINVKVLGLAMNLAGGVGPTLLRVIKRCSEIAGGRVPVWAARNWTAATFVGAWAALQRMVSAVQPGRFSPFIILYDRCKAGISFDAFITNKCIKRNPCFATIIQNDKSQKTKTFFIIHKHKQ